MLLHTLPSSLSSSSSPSPFAVHLPIDRKDWARESGGEKVSFELHSTFNFFCISFSRFMSLFVLKLICHCVELFNHYTAIFDENSFELEWLKHCIGFLFHSSPHSSTWIRSSFAFPFPSLTLKCLYYYNSFSLSLPPSRFTSFHIDFIRYIVISCFICAHTMRYASKKFPCTYL